MYTGIGASGTDEFDRTPADALDRSAEVTEDGALGRVLRESVEVGSVVGDGEGGVTGVQTSSMRAIWALSPSRGPSFKMRV